ncbi:DNA methyltransferase [Microbacterium sp. Root280D1]|uniref:DNA methyltransferase n=1 Tax=Microbacterium sp. Root280D1 TaxID=1736510 RepID=UPI0006FAEF0F|nr:DNA methyltransferase [Microbacterium sp. Root280D1]KRD53733.1 hypothetical protein ASE34_01100 [Microbacterium sp. Root280D1]
MSGSDLSALYTEPIPADRTGALYNAFSYPTKISAESIALFIACHTKPGAHVLDTFGGSGSTAIAALLCERPTPRMLALAEQRGLHPVWGPRDATIYELSEIGTLLARVMTSAPNPAGFARAAHHLLESAREAEQGLYAAAGPDGERGEVRQVIWSDVVACPACGVESTYADTRVRYEPLRLVEDHVCVCGHAGKSADWVRQVESITDPWTGEVTTRRRRVPWKVYGRSGRKNWSRPAEKADDESEKAAAARPLPAGSPLSEIRWGDLHRAGYHQGITHLHHLYTARNFRALCTLWDRIDEEPVEFRDALKLLVLSYNASHATLMTRVVMKKNAKDFVVTGAQSGVLYVSSLPVEKNVFTGIERKVRTFVNAFELLHGLNGRANVVTGSSTALHLEDRSIDYVFTDPPFGGYIPYSEINQINELWLGKTTEVADEAIVSPAQGKDVDDYQRLLTSVFSEVTRVMRDDSEATLVFHSSQAAVWRALSSSLNDAGLEVSAASILDKTQPSFKQVNGHTAVSGDPLLRLRKRREEISEVPSSTETMLDLMRTRLEGTGHNPADQRREFSMLVGRALVDGVPITLDASAVYARQVAP